MWIYKNKVKKESSVPNHQSEKLSKHNHVENLVQETEASSKKVIALEQVGFMSQNVVSEVSKAPAILCLASVDF